LSEFLGPQIYTLTTGYDHPQITPIFTFCVFFISLEWLKL